MTRRKIESLDTFYKAILEDVGAIKTEPKYMDVENTPARVGKMMREEVLASYKIPLSYLKKGFTTFPAEHVNGEPALPPIVVENSIPVYSLCAHHMLPFFGTCSIGYVPKKKLAGLSKLPRTVLYFSRKLQTQERLTENIADFLVEMLEPEGLIVLIEARHLCMEMRGIRAPGVETKTSTLRGSAFNETVRSEFYRLLK